RSAARVRGAHAGGSASRTGSAGDGGSGRTGGRAVSAGRTVGAGGAQDRDLGAERAHGAGAGGAGADRHRPRRSAGASRQRVGAAASSGGSRAPLGAGRVFGRGVPQGGARDGRLAGTTNPGSHVPSGRVRRDGGSVIPRIVPTPLAPF